MRRGREPQRGSIEAFVVVAAAAIATSGCHGAGGDEPPGDPIDVSGRWAMFVFEDPVAVELKQSGDVVTGRGCCHGFARSDDFDCCGLITDGRVEGRHLSFSFTFGFGGEHYVYGTDGLASTDGRRITGSFTRAPDRPVTWVRIADNATSLRYPERSVEEAMAGYSGAYALSLSGASPGASAFSPSGDYRLDLSAPGGVFVSGDLGAFWVGEMSWQQDTRTLVVGPVPETTPNLPVALSLQFDEAALVSVEAAMASGERYVFRAERGNQPSK